MESTRCAYCSGPLNLARAGAKFCSQQCGVYYRRRSLPRELTSRPRWVRHDSRKRPLDPRTGRIASVDDPSTWGSYSEAKASTHGVGMGFVLTADDDISCIDLDGVLIDGVLVPAARAVLDSTADVFVVERSVGGHGVHIWHRGPVGSGSNRVEGEIRVERYSRGRFIAVTGLRLGL